MEELDICDEQGNPTGQIITRKEAHERGILHRTAHIWVIQRTGKKVQLLLQKRSMQKESYPGKLDTSAAGHILAGDEPLPSAIRELYEELGIQAKEEDLKFVDRFRIQYEKEFHGKSFKDNEIIFIYVYDKETGLQDIVIQKEELDSVEWMDAEYVYNACVNHDPRFCIPEKNIRTLMNYLSKQETK